jgi:3,4-dihydroxy 2-butanone 4-phosphate synthase/GTP cyclohydrolase II
MKDEHSRKLYTINHNEAVEAVLATLSEYGQTASHLDAADPFDRPLYGTTMYVARCSLETRFGPFCAYVFQDIIVKNYIVALVRGDIHGPHLLYTRLHSSCVTSETLRGADCDCVQQLEGAFKVISEKGHGVLWYLLQEGRGTGYVPKARDRMLVQASADKLSTFQAYKLMGLKKDYRDYRNIRDICHLLDITAARWVILTNNPDKVAAMRELGLHVAAHEALEFDPGPFNLSYLQSKAESGHILDLPARATGIASALPPEPVKLFKPYALPDAQRFVYSASYYLPVKPVNEEILLDENTFAQLFPNGPTSITSGSISGVVGVRALSNGRYMVKVDEEAIMQRRHADPADPLTNIVSTPYWFRVHVYYDMVTGLDHVILTHGDPSKDVPIVRVHSESLFNRFPLCDVSQRDKYKAAVQRIVEHGTGIVVLLYNDGRGAGFGAHALDKMLQESHLVARTDDAYSLMGVTYDSRDYDATFALLRHHVKPHMCVQMLSHEPNSIVVKPELVAAIHRSGINVTGWQFIKETC